MSIQRAFLLSLLAALASACSDSEAVKSESPSPCSSDRDCRAGEICFEDGCGSAVEFAIRVTPGEDNGLPVQDFNPVSVTSSRLELWLRPAGAIQGVLRLSRDGEITDYPAVEPQGNEPGRSFTIHATGRSSTIPRLPFDQPLKAIVTSGAAFFLPAPAGVWEVSAVSSDLTLPPVSSQKLVRAEESVDPQLVLIGDNLSTITGRVVKTADIPWPKEATPRFQFQVLDAESQSPLSQVTRLFAATELFSVTALRTGGRVLLRVIPEAVAQSACGADPARCPLAPTKEFLSDESGRFSGFELGDYGAPFEATGRVVDQAGAPVANAVVRIEGKVRGGGALAVARQTDADGRFNAWLLDSGPGAGYQITVTPPMGSPAARTVVFRSLVGPARVEIPEVVCDSKAELRGTVLGPAGQPVAGILVHYEGHADSPTPGASSGDAVTGSDGRFFVRVERGDYRVTAMPDRERHLPWASRLALGPDPYPVEIRLSGPREVIGTVLSRTGDGRQVSIPRATVTVFRMARPDGGEPYPVPIYKALSDNLGQFRLVLPKASTGD